jgi:hypothetical protein
MRTIVLSLVVALGFAASSVVFVPGISAVAYAQGNRDRTRPTYTRDSMVTENQATELTLTVAPVALQTLQTWVRTAGVLDVLRKTLHACIAGPEGALVSPGQRIRAFSPESKSSVYQAWVASVAPGDPCAAVVATLASPVYGDATRYVLEIIVDRGQRLAVANSAIIERDGQQIVYVQLHPGHYDPREIHTGIAGELYTEVLDGLVVGQEVVTIGSFFVDAEYRLAATRGQGMDAHSHH